MGEARVSIASLAAASGHRADLRLTMGERFDDVVASVFLLRPGSRAIGLPLWRPVGSTQHQREADMTDYPIRDSGHAQSNTVQGRGTRLRHRQPGRSLWGSPREWFAASRGAADAEDAYDAARARGKPHDRAAREAFEALTGEPMRLGDEPARSRYPSREFDDGLDPRDTANGEKQAQGDLRVAILCLLLFAGMAFLGIVLSLGIDSPT